MTYGIILASGKGNRMNDNDIPKQFRLINDIPVLIHTINKFLKNENFDSLYVAVPQDYLDYAKDLINKFITKDNEKVKIISGGNERIDSIENSINAIIKENNYYESDIVVIHDGVRPLVTDKILNDSIEGAKKYGAVVCAVPVTDTLLISNDCIKVDNIPNRSLYYKGQAPDSFKLQLFVELLNNLTEEQRKTLTGTSQVCTMNNYPLHMIKGDEINMKITTSSDFEIIANLIERNN